MEHTNCIKLTYETIMLDGSTRTSTILGKIEKEDDQFLFFITERKHYRIAKNTIRSMVETSQRFRNGDGNYGRSDR